MLKEIDSLTPHPMNIEIYGEDSISADFIDSIRKFGILTPLLILENGTIISGHRRWKAAKSIGLSRVPVQISPLANPLDIKQAIIEGNRQREKTFSQKMREAEALEEILKERKEKERRKKLGKLKTTVENFPPSANKVKEKYTRDEIAKAIDLGSGRQYEKAKKIWKPAQEGNPIAQDQIAKLDAGEITIHAALRTLSGATAHNNVGGIDPAGYDGDEWFTPLEIIELARQVMGEIDLDPATRLAAQEKIKAKDFFTKKENGLEHPWYGKVWLNPPYSAPLCSHFVEKLICEYIAGHTTEAIILVNNSTETAWFQALLSRYTACFLRSRLKFWRDNGEVFGTRQGQVIFYVGHQQKTFYMIFHKTGIILERIRKW